MPRRLDDPRARIGPRQLVSPPPADADGYGLETTASIASLVAASPLSAAESRPRPWRGRRACDTFVLATVHAER